MPARSPCAGVASSPFAAQTRQPFPDHISCRSNLSDYGYTTASDDEESDFEGAHQEQGTAGGVQRSANVAAAAAPPPEEGMGFWADVGACSTADPGAACGLMCAAVCQGGSAFMLCLGLVRFAFVLMHGVRMLMSLKWC